MKPLVLVYRKCTTCQKALKWLEENKIAYEERPIKEENPTEEELREWYKKSGLPLKRFFNTSGNLYKELQLKDKLADMSEEEQIKLLAGFRIETGEELLSFIEETEEKIKNLENERQKIYNKIQRVKTPEEEEKLKQRAKDISAEIKPLRKQKKTAEEIAETIPKIKELLRTEMEMEVSALEKENTRQRSRER